MKKEEKVDLNLEKEKNEVEENVSVKEKVVQIDNTKKLVKKEKSKYLWVIEIGLLALALSMLFSVLSEYLLADTNIIIVLIVILVLLFTNVFFDMIGLAFASCKIEPLVAMAAKKVRGSKLAISLVKNADRVSSVCSDVIGDICGILCGAAGVTITVVLVGNMTGGSAEILIGAAVSAVIAGLTIFFKALCKNLAINKSTEIVMMVSKTLSIFSFKKGK